ncbi:sensor histidine kinase [Paenibacillus abyssi]|uniref:histidine kinase n=1 Tax=Paenibacillus abyssi TaxID=1340531 RepID=A0A917FWJ4_9BACL|nr:HAMP domain-containing sensor histidine kinase [Paenibacillus abyssi]GGG11697.1 two-component sensor histidine kinase [Paenibacillus abyssi]
MSIRVKLKLTLLAMVIVPQLLLIIVALLVTPIFQGKVHVFKTYEVNQELLLHLSEVTGEVKYVASHDPDRFKEPEYVQSVMNRFEQWNSGFILTEGGEVTASPNWLADTAKQTESTVSKAQSADNIKIGAENYSIHKETFTYSDGSAGEYTLLYNYEPIPVYMRPLIFIALLISIGVTHFVLSYLVSRSLIRPLDELKGAVEQIKDGNLNFVVKPTSNDEIGQLGTAFEDMRSRLKTSIDQSLQYEENRKELISNISHDLKTPITAIKGYVEGILDGVANTEEKREKYIRTIYSKASEMDKLIDELFLFSKLDLNKETYDFQSFDLHRYLSDYMEERQFDMEKSGVILEFVPAANVPVHVTADREKLSRVLSNIIDNSLKYMKVLPAGREKRVTVSLKEKEDCVKVEIQDTGPGINKQALPHIFDRFYRAEQSRSSANGGSGLGLAIVKHIVEGHGGTAEAASIEGQGSKIAFTLPKSMSKEATVKKVEENFDH